MKSLRIIDYNIIMRENSKKKKKCNTYNNNYVVADKYEKRIYKLNKCSE